MEELLFLGIAVVMPLVGLFFTSKQDSVRHRIRESLAISWGAIGIFTLLVWLYVVVDGNIQTRVDMSFLLVYSVVLIAVAGFALPHRLRL